MAFIDMDLYNKLYDDMRQAKAENVKLGVRINDIKKDVEKRKKARKHRIVFLWIALITFVVGTLCVLIATQSGIIGGHAEGGGAVKVPFGPEFLKFLEGWFVAITWAMCWVGFPVGWNWTKKERNDAKNELYVTHTIHEDGTVETSTSKLAPRIGAFVTSLLMGVLTFCFSLPIAVVQVFWGMPSDIDYIQTLIIDKFYQSPDVFVVLED